MAKWMPASSRPGTFRSRGWPAPPASSIASYRARMAAAGTVAPTSVLGRNTTPSASSIARRRSRNRFSILNSGIP